MPSALTATPDGAVPTLIVVVTVLVAVLILVTVLEPALATHTPGAVGRDRDALRIGADLDGGDHRVGGGVDHRHGARAAVGDIGPRAVGGLTATADGELPTVIVALTVFVAVSITDTVLAPRLVT